MPFKTCAMAALGDIDTLRGSIPDLVVVIVEIFENCNSVKFCVVLNLCKIEVYLYHNFFCIAIKSSESLWAEVCLH